MDPTAPKQSYHHGTLKTAALNAALAHLAQGGEDLPSLRDLAGELGVSHRALYRHFADKEGLLREIVAIGFSRLAALMAEHADKGAAGAMEAFLDFAFEQPGLYRLMLSLRSTNLLAEHIPGPQVRAVINLAMQAFDQGIGQSDEAIRNQVFSAWGLVHGLYELWRSGVLRAASPNLAKDFIRARLLDSGLVAGVTPHQAMT